MGVLGALVVLLIFGGAAAIVNFNAPWHDAQVAVPIIGVAGGAIALLILVLSAPGIVVGFGLYRFSPWARVLGIVLSALDLLHVPIGTAIGVYGLWVLLNPRTEPLFRPRPALAYR
ncbi:MAG: hypothetical protein HY822_12760 [Acidobacteria bacterium]|nr:hypothetical protein [Acidobacteriota bacterium]